MITLGALGGGGTDAAFGEGKPSKNVLSVSSDVSLEPSTPFPPVCTSTPSDKSERCQVFPDACEFNAITICDAIDVSGKYADVSASASGPSIKIPVLSTASTLSPQTT